MPTQTQVLEDQIARLEARIRQLKKRTGLYYFKRPDTLSVLPQSPRYDKPITPVTSVRPAFHAMCPFLQDNQAIASTTWMIILSIIPSDLVRVGAISLGSAPAGSHGKIASATPFLGGKTSNRC